jgi:hypothetical protein
VQQAAKPIHDFKQEMLNNVKFSVKYGRFDFGDI